MVTKNQELVLDDDSKDILKEVESILENDSKGIFDSRDLSKHPTKTIKAALIQLFVNSQENMLKVPIVAEELKVELKKQRKKMRATDEGLKVTELEQKLYKLKKTGSVVKIERNSILKLAASLGINMTKDIKNIIAVSKE